jgi:hypothetical protein
MIYYGLILESEKGNPGNLKKLNIFIKKANFAATVLIIKHLEGENFYRPVGLLLFKLGIN